METLMKMKWKIGSVEIENPFILAPMAGVTDLPFRILCKEQGQVCCAQRWSVQKAISFHNKKYNLSYADRSGGASGFHAEFLEVSRI